MHALMHGPTFMGNALACAAANASLDLFAEEDRLGQVAAISEAPVGRPRAVPRFAGVRNVRVKGAIGVVELDRLADVNDLKRRFVDAGVWVRPFGNIVYLTPAFTIDGDDLERLTGAIRIVLAGRE